MSSVGPRKADFPICEIEIRPLAFTPFPGIIYGYDLGSDEGRRAYVEGVVADALRP